METRGHCCVAHQTPSTVPARSCRTFRPNVRSCAPHLRRHDKASEAFGLRPMPRVPVATFPPRPGCILMAATKDDCTEYAQKFSVDEGAWLLKPRVSIVLIMSK